MINQWKFLIICLGILALSFAALTFEVGFMSVLFNNDEIKHPHMTVEAYEPADNPNNGVETEKSVFPEAAPEKAKATYYMDRINDKSRKHTQSIPDLS